MKQKLFRLVLLLSLLTGLLGVQPASALDPVQIRWFVGLGTGSDANQTAIEQQVVDDFNAAYLGSIELTLEIVPNGDAFGTLANEIASSSGPDIVGPVGWAGANAFHDQWADLDPLITAASYDTSQFPVNLVNIYHTDIGQEGLPFALYPSAIFYNKSLFTAAGLYYPPSRYGDQYEMPDGSMVDWNWTTIAIVGKLLTLDINGKNSTQVGFDSNHIVQYGWSWQWESKPSYVGSYWKSGTNETFLAPGGTLGNYDARIPAAWQDAWNWMYDGIWGAQPFIPNGTVAESPDFGGGNLFDSGKIAMIEHPIWYTCCIGDVNVWDLAIMPGNANNGGQVAGRIDADTFRILKDSPNKTEAFTVMSYLIGTGVQKLIIGDETTPAPYGGMPARITDQLPWRVAKHTQFPWVQNWKTAIAGLNYPDSPSAETWMPNFNRAFDRSGEFYNQLLYNSGLIPATEAENFRANLEDIFNGVPSTNISLSSSNINENLPAGTSIGTLTSSGGSGSSFSYSLCGGPDDAAFQISGDDLQSADLFDYETKNTYGVCVRTTDELGLSFAKTLTVTVNDLAETTEQFQSVGAQDGWILESTETSNTGGTMNATQTTFQLGDDAGNRQYRSVLSFDTSSLLDGAVIQSAVIKIKQSGPPSGSNPFTALGGLLVDVRKPNFGTTSSLQLTDFNAAATKTKVGTFDKTPSLGWYTVVLNADGRNNVNLANLTQFRLYFTKDDNNDLGADFIKFSSGNAPAASRPILLITYYVP